LLKNDLAGIEVVNEQLETLNVVADPGMIEHTLVNLIQNSIHATGLTERPQIIIRIYCLKKTIHLEIEDNGCGIPEEYIDNVFDPSFSLKGGQDVHGRYKGGIKGTGYGLANVKKYIELHKGKVLIESKSDCGTKVSIFMPKIENRLTKEEVAEVQKTRNYSKRHILLVEDEPAISEVQ
ncbi:MAG: ATP-binding protein, partial [Gammaproteobacteria bacterium]|nr:ATP-binding protein [Gammaproteobacteria bacterium]